MEKLGYVQRAVFIALATKNLMNYQIAEFFGEMGRKSYPKTGSFILVFETLGLINSGPSAGGGLIIKLTEKGHTFIKNNFRLEGQNEGPIPETTISSAGNDGDVKF